MIKFSNVSLIYPQSTKTVLEGLTCEIEEGEMVLVMGHTGSGKSSLLRLINGLVPHHTGGILAGSITVDGISTREVKPGSLAHLVGIVGQNPINAWRHSTSPPMSCESGLKKCWIYSRSTQYAIDQFGL